MDLSCIATKEAVNTATGGKSVEKVEADTG